MKRHIMKQFTKENLFGVREPKLSFISDHKIVIVVDPDADLWQETYYNNILKANLAIILKPGKSNTCRVFKRSYFYSSR